MAENLEILHLRAQAARCRRLAAMASDDRTRDALTELAFSYADQADGIADR